MRLIILTFLLASSLCEIPSLSTFDQERYSGTWYEAARTRNVFPEHADHNKVVYKLEIPGQINVTSFLKLPYISYKTPGVLKPEGGVPGRFRYSMQIISYNTLSTPYYVIDTDYDNYSLVYSYTTLENETIQRAWIYVRKIPVDDNLLAFCIERMENLVGINKQDFKVTAQ